MFDRSCYLCALLGYPTSANLGPGGVPAGSRRTGSRPRPRFDLGGRCHPAAIHDGPARRIPPNDNVKQRHTAGGTDGDQTVLTSTYLLYISTYLHSLHIYIPHTAYLYSFSLSPLL